jgi:hypothetical protein
MREKNHSKENSSRLRRPSTGALFSPGQAYANAAMAQIPRALTLLDHNPASPTYGCFDRSWWLDRATDFPNALAQYAVHGLALVWAHPLPDNPYYQNPVLRNWIEAGLSFLVKQAHGDGSFDEFYPNERGWSGPSGFLLYAMLSAYELIGVEPDSDLGKSVRDVAGRCARMHLERTERGTLANHYAMAFLPVAKARRILADDSLEAPLQRRFEDLLALQDSEGWFREYDGPDPGYLSATVSFLAKMEHEGFRHPGLRPAVEKALGFIPYFLWPDGTFGGALGSRQTVHLYPHGLEYFAADFPQAAALAKAARRGWRIRPARDPIRPLLPLPHQRIAGSGPSSQAAGGADASASIRAKTLFPLFPQLGYPSGKNQKLLRGHEPTQGRRLAGLRDARGPGGRNGQRP